MTSSHVPFCSICKTFALGSKLSYYVFKKTDMPFYYSTHCGNVKIWSRRAQHSSCVLNRYPAMYVILCVAEKNGSYSSFFSHTRRKLCFVINVLNNKTYAAQSCGILPDFSKLGLRLLWLSIKPCSARFRRTMVKYSEFL